MSGKRGPTSDLTDRNWDQEEEVEEAGVFAQASKAILKKREIKVAKRRVPTSDDGETKPAFAGFGGFALKPQTSTQEAADAVNTKVFAKAKPAFDSNKPFQNGESSKGGNSEYLNQLKSLNECVLKWIQQHVNKNPYCILTPIFSDYGKHLKEIEEKYPNKSSPGKEEEVKTADKSEVVEKTVDVEKPQVTEKSEVVNKEGDSEKPQEKEETKDKEEKKDDKPPSGSIFGGFGGGGLGGGASKPFTFGMMAPSAGSTFDPSSFSGFKFASVPKPDASSGFSFAVSKPASGGTTSTPQEGDEEYVPPRLEVKEVEEEGAVYTKRCKLFYQKDDAWVEKGVGNLHLKVIEEKTQLVIRADTSLGNILLNILLTSAIPINRQGKNNVSVFCVPNPPIHPKQDSTVPASMLIRVKTGEDADTLLEKINELRN